MEFNFTKMREVCIPNRPIIQKLLHVLHNNHRLGDSEEIEMILEKRRHGFCQVHVQLQKHFPYFTQLSPLEICRRNVVVTVFIFKVQLGFEFKVR